MDDYRITSLVEIDELLKRLLNANALMTLSGPGGTNYTTMLWAVDSARGVVCFSAEAGDTRLQALLETEEVVAVGYLDSIKLQFDLDGVVQVHGNGSVALNAQYPRTLYRFQRRSSFRVKPMISSIPVAHMRHPAVPDMKLDLRVLDISLSGVALFLPHNLPMVSPGVKIGQCFLDLDSDTRLEIGLIIHHVSVINPESQGARLGCELVNLNGASERALQQYINQTEKRRLALATRQD
ncbi:flagellar brake protein [Aquabacterium sp.]|uniref:flagellar brake protein n=1 Tax=Aquabacterium sp. TaxID=1872578 RepID=UPI0025BC0171|nr:flagellar brake protein [Aquabacterium sp.]